MRRIALAIVLSLPAAALVFAPQRSYREVAPIIYRSCTPCHSPHGPAPFSLRDYGEARRRADRIGINVVSKAMPPCQLFSDFGSFSSVPGLLTREIVALREWATSGAAPTPEGDTTSSLPEPPSPKPFRWRLGQPSILLKHGAIGVPAEGGIHRIFTKLRMKEGGWVRGLELRPKDPKTIRQATIGWARPGIASPKGATTLPSGVTPLGSWAFGYYTWRTPKGSGFYVPPGSDIHVMLQCQAVGKPGNAAFDLGAYFEENHQASTEWIVIEKRGFTIDIGEKPTYVVEKSLEHDAYITALLPEFRYACERVSLTAALPNGEQKRLMEGRWDVYWTGSYSFIDPPRLPAGTQLTLRAEYNNGFEATHGPDVRVPIRNGTGLQDELCKVSVQTVRASP